MKAEAEKKKKEELKEQQRLEVIREAQAERDRRVQVVVFFFCSFFIFVGCQNFHSFYDLQTLMFV